MKRGCAVLLFLMALGSLFGLLTSAVVTYMMPKQYESEAVIEVKPRPVGVTSGPSAPSMQMSPQFFATEFEKIKSHKALEKVVANLSLTNRWNIDRESAVLTLKKIVTTQNIRGTDLISIRVRHTSNIDARDIAEEVAKSYREYRNEIETRDQENVLIELNKAVRDQEDKVEERRKLLATIVNTKGIIYKGQDSLYNQRGIDDGEAAKNVLQEFEKLNAERIQLRSQIENLLKYENDELLVYAAGLDLPDNIVRKMLPKYQEAKRNLETLKTNGMGADHPTVMAAAKELETMKTQLDEGAVQLREILSAQLELADRRIQEVEKRKDKAREDAIKNALDAQDYVDAKREFEADQEILQQLKMKKISADIGGRIPFQSVEIHDSPMVSDAPVSPNVTLNLVLGTVAGFILFPIAGLLVMGVMRICGTPK